MRITIKDAAIIKANNNRIMRYINTGMIIFNIIMGLLLLAGSGYLYMKHIRPEQETRMKDAYAGSPANVITVKTLYCEDVIMIAKIVECEAGNQCDEGKRLVADTVLNRVDHEGFPDNVMDVVEARGQYAVVGGRRYLECEPPPETLEMVAEEMDRRTDSEVIYFCSTGYVNGTPMFKVQDHYFSKR